MAERGRVWSESETRTFLEIWSEREIQRKLQAAVRNDVVFIKIAEELAKRGYQRTVAQCRGKIKALKNRYKHIVDRLRRSGAGRESDEESEVPADFPYFSALDAVLGRRASVTPVQLLDTAEASQHGTSASRPITPSSTASIIEEPPSPVLAFRPAEVDTAELGQQDSPNVSTPGPSASTSRPSTPVPIASAAIGMQGPPSNVVMSRSGSHEEAPGPSSSRSSGTPSKKSARGQLNCQEQKHPPKALSLTFWKGKTRQKDVEKSLS